MKRLQIELLTNLIKYDTKYNDDFSESFLIGSFKSNSDTYDWIEYTTNQLNYWIEKGNKKFIKLIQILN